MINVEEFKKVQKYLTDLEKIDLTDLEVEGIVISDKLRKDWSYVGLNNRYFVQNLIEWAEQGDNPREELWEADDE